MEDLDMELLISLEEADLDWVTQLVALRKIKGMSQTEVAERMGITQPNVSRLEKLASGATRKHTDLLTRYAEAVGAFTGHVVVDAADGRYDELQRVIQKHLRSLKRQAVAVSGGSAVSDSPTHPDSRSVGEDITFFLTEFAPAKRQSPTATVQQREIRWSTAPDRIGFLHLQQGIRTLPRKEEHHGPHSVS